MPSHNKSRRKKQKVSYNPTIDYGTIAHYRKGDACNACGTRPAVHSLRIGMHGVVVCAPCAHLLAHSIVHHLNGGSPAPVPLTVAQAMLQIREQQVAIAVDSFYGNMLARTEAVLAVHEKPLKQITVAELREAIGPVLMQYRAAVRAWIKQHSRL